MSCSEYEQAREEKDQELMDEEAARRRADQAASLRTIQRITKPCPSCNNPIQKDDGCNHMTCTCRHEFCWTCLGPYYEPKKRRRQPRKYHCDQARCFNYPGGTA